MPESAERAGEPLRCVGARENGAELWRDVLEQIDRLLAGVLRDLGIVGIAVRLVRPRRALRTDSLRAERMRSRGKRERSNEKTCSIQ